MGTSSRFWLPKYWYISTASTNSCSVWCLGGEHVCLCSLEVVFVVFANKDLTPGEVKLLQRGPKFAVTTTNVPITEYIAVTKQICDRLGENTEGVDCSEYYQKTKDLLQDYKDKHAPHPNTTKQEREAIKLLKEDNTRVVLTADKGVAMVVMDKSTYIEKCMTLLQDTNVYQPCRDQTGQIHRLVQASLRKLKGKHGKGSPMGKTALQPFTTFRQLQPTSKILWSPKNTQSQLSHMPHCLSLWHINIQLG